MQPSSGGVSLLQIFNISLLLLAFLFMMGMLYLPLRERDQVAEARKDFIRTVALVALGKAGGELPNAGANQSKIGEVAINAYIDAKRSSSEGGSNGSPPGGPPEGPPPVWELQLPCKLIIKKAWPLNLFGWRGAITFPELNICEGAIYACTGAVILTCRADQSMACVNKAIDQKCEFS